MTFYNWEGSVISSVTENLYYKITVTSRFETSHFSVDPLFYIDPSFRVESVNPLLQSIRIMKIEYIITDSPFLSQASPPAEDFPAGGFALMDPAGSDITFSQIGRVGSGVNERFRNILYLQISPDTLAVAGIINALGHSVEPHLADNILTLSFGFRSVPFYTAPSAGTSTTTAASEPP
jgi:hypothetical protein